MQNIYLTVYINGINIMYVCVNYREFWAAYCTFYQFFIGTSARCFEVEFNFAFKTNTES